MNRLILALVISHGLASAAESTSSLAGTVFREKGGYVHLRLGWERTIIFRNETEYTYVKALAQSLVTGNWRVETPPPDGTYVYTKTDPSTGELTFSDSFIDRITGSTENAPRPLRLDFVDGDFGEGPRGDFGHGTHSFSNPPAHFALAKLPTVEGWPMANVSMRGNVAAETPLIVGFILKEDRRDVVIRIVGPSLRQFGVSRPWENPQFLLYSAGSSAPLSGGPGPRHGIAYYEDWSSFEASTTGLTKLFSYTGAFPLDVGSGDAVGVTPRLLAGAYTIVCTPGVDSTGGEALVEVYVLP
jgi:hypothetical protein